MPIHLWFGAIFVVALALAVPLVILAERAGRRAGLVDMPRRGEVQRYILPRTGGYGIYAAFWLAVGFSFVIVPVDLERLPADNTRLIGVFLGSLLLLPLALADDRRRLGPWSQFAGQIAAATVPVLFGVRMAEIATPFGPLALPDLLAAPLAVFWIVAMINAINLIDNMDGLAGGISGIASAVLFLRSAWFGQYSIAVLPLALSGACLGFLTRNWHPSRVIMGSSGALFLGYMLGVITLLGGVKIGTAFLVLAVPIVDVLWVMYRRVAQGRSPFRGGDAQHLPHRLRLLGWSDSAIVLFLYGVCAIIGGVVLFTHSALPTLEKLVMSGVVVIGVLVLIVVVARVTSSPSAVRGEPVEPRSR